MVKNMSSLIPYFTSVNFGVSIIGILLNMFNIAGLPDNIANYLVVVICVWVFISGSSLSYVHQRFVTPTIANKKCHFCDKYLVTSELYCESCGAISKRGDIKQNKED